MSAVLAGAATGPRSERVRAFVAAHPGLFDEVSDAAIATLLQGKLSRQIAYLSQFAGVEAALAALAQLSEATILLLGVGGVGSHLADHLVRLGVTRFVLVDPDEVHVSNLNRQILYSAADVGQTKILAAKRRLENIAGVQLDIHGFPSFNDATDWLSRSQVRPAMVFVSADEAPFALRREVIGYAFPRALPYCFVGYVGARGIISPAVFHPANVCGACAVMGVHPETWMHDLVRFKAGDLSPSSYSINAVAAAFAVEAWTRDLLGEKTEAFELQISLGDLSLTRTRLASDPTCPVCGAHEE